MNPVIAHIYNATVYSQHSVTIGPVHAAVDRIVVPALRKQAGQVDVEITGIKLNKSTHLVCPDIALDAAGSRDTLPGSYGCILEIGLEQETVLELSVKPCLEGKIGKKTCWCKVSKCFDCSLRKFNKIICEVHCHCQVQTGSIYRNGLLVATGIIQKQTVRTPGPVAPVKFEIVQPGLPMTLRVLDQRQFNAGIGQSNLVQGASLNAFCIKRQGLYACL